jgi:hypothetical protein
MWRKEHLKNLCVLRTVQISNAVSMTRRLAETPVIAFEIKNLQFFQRCLSKGKVIYIISFLHFGHKCK